MTSRVEKTGKAHPSFRRNLSEYFTEYTENTGIHGSKYIGEKGRSLFEKFLWLIFFCFSLYLCTILTLNVWDKWNTSPVLVSFATKPTLVSKIPFPAVTICSDIKIKRSLFNFTDVYHRAAPEPLDGQPINATNEELKWIDQCGLICDNFVYNDGFNTTPIYETIEHIVSLAPTLEETFASCNWAGEEINCSKLFFPTLTEDGLCFTFNMLNASDLFTENAILHGKYNTHERDSSGWSLEDGYASSSSLDDFPLRVLSAGENAGLSLILKFNYTDFDFVCRGGCPHFRLLLHNSAEFPRVGTYFFRVPLDEEMVVSVKPDMMTTSEGLKEYEPERRKCFFSKEKSLTFFKSYTQDSCDAECLLNYTLYKCGCVSFNMPHDNTTEICGSRKNPCVQEAKVELLQILAETGITNGKNSSVTECNCKPSCFSLNYHAEVSQGTYDWKKDPKLKGRRFTNGNEDMRMTKLSIFFKNMQFITSERNELYGPAAFIANCGGLLGLFTGFSFLSIIEILHFFTLRLFCNLKRHGRHYWSGSENLIKKL